MKSSQYDSENSYIDLPQKGGFQPPELPFGIVTDKLKKKYFPKPVV